MKKGKKWLAAVLSGCMVLSSIVPAFAAAASEDPVKDFTDKVTSTSKWSDELSSDWKALNDDQKNSIDPNVFGKQVLYKASNFMKDKPEANKSDKWAWLHIEETLPLTDKIKTALEVNSMIDGTYIKDSVNINEHEYSYVDFEALGEFDFKNEVTADNEKVYTAEQQKQMLTDMLSEYNKLDAWQQDVVGNLFFGSDSKYTDSENKNYVTGYSSTSLSGVGDFYTVVFNYSAVELGIDISTEADAAQLNKVVDKMLEHLTVDSNLKKSFQAIRALIPTYEAYAAKESTTDEEKQAYVDWYNNDFSKVIPAKATDVTETVFGYAWGSTTDKLIVVEGKLSSISSFKSSAKSAKETAENEIAAKAFDQYMAELTWDTADAESVTAAYNEMTAKFEELSSKAQGMISEESKTKKAQLEQDYANVEINGFKDKVNAVVIPEAPSAEFNETITALKADFKALTKSAQEAIQADEVVWAKYNAIIANGLNTNIIKNEHQAPDSVVVSGKDTIINDIIAETVAPNVANLLPMLAQLIVPGTDAKTISGAIEQAYFTDSTVTSLMKMLFPALANSVSMLSINPSAVAKTLEKIDAEAYADAIEKLNASNDDWTAVPDDIIWGVKDYETFKNALCAVLEGINNGLVAILLPNIIAELLADQFATTPDGKSIDYTEEFKNGLYSRGIIPLFEILGVQDYMSALDYSNKVNAKEKPYIFKNALEPVLDALWGLVMQIEKDPVAWAGEYLPGIVYHLNDGCVFKDIEAGLDYTISIADINIKDTINGLIAGSTLGVATLGEINLKVLLNAAMQGDPNVENIYNILMDLTKLGKAYNKQVDGIAYDSLTLIDGDKSSVVNYVANKVIDVLADILANEGIKLDFKAGTFKPVDVPKYPNNGDCGPDVILKTIEGIDSILTNFVNLDAELSKLIATGSNAAAALTGIYGALETVPQLAQLGIGVTPAQLSELLAKAYPDLSKALAGAATWADVKLDGVNMGFKDGDLNGFINAMKAYFRPLFKTLIDTKMFLNNGAEGSYGMYETFFVPVYEALGLNIAATSDELTLMYNDTLAKSGADAACDLVVDKVLAPVLDLYKKLVAAPVDTLTSVLPTIAYAIQYNSDIAFLGNMLKNDKGVIDLAAMVNPYLTIVGIKLPYIDLDLLASAGDVKDIASKSLRRDTFKGVVADQGEAFLVIAGYLAETIRGNADAILKLLENVDLGSMSGLVTSIINDLANKSNDEFVVFLAQTFGGYEPSMTDDNISDTGDTSVSLGYVFAAFALAGVAVVLLRRRKKVNE